MVCNPSVSVTATQPTDIKQYDADSEYQYDDQDSSQPSFAEYTVSDGDDTAIEDSDEDAGLPTAMKDSDNAAGFPAAMGDSDDDVGLPPVMVKSIKRLVTSKSEQRLEDFLEYMLSHKMDLESILEYAAKCRNLV